MKKILIVEQNAAERERLMLHLTVAGYRCDSVSDPAEAMNALEYGGRDMILLSSDALTIQCVGLLDYARALGVPVMMLSAGGRDEDVIRALRAGADDYVVRSQNTDLLLARTEALLRRCSLPDEEPTAQPPLLRYGEYTVHVRSNRVVRGDGEIPLTPKEFALLVLFVSHRGEVLSRERIYSGVWGEEPNGRTRTVELHVQRLRAKLGLGEQLRAIYGVGYILD